MALGPAVAGCTTPEATGKLSEHSIVFGWENTYRGEQKGTVTIREGARSGSISLKLPDNASCDGRIWFTNGTKGNWDIDCGGFTAQGRFRGLGAGKGALGEGTDSMGRKVYFFLGAEWPG